MLFHFLAGGDCSSVSRKASRYDTVARETRWLLFSSSRTISSARETFYLSFFRPLPALCFARRRTLVSSRHLSRDRLCRRILERSDGSRARITVEPGAHSRNLERAAIKVRNKAIGEARPRSHDNCRLRGSGRAIHRKSHGCTACRCPEE